MSDVLSVLFQHMDQVAMRHDGDDQYTILNQFQPWFAELWPKAYAQPKLSLRGVSDFLDNFLYDAAMHWQAKSDETLKSGPFIQPGSNDQEYPLEATAMTVDGVRILILVNLGDSYRENLELMQAARENLLTQETLEVEVSRRTQEIRDREAEIAGRLIYAAGFRDEETGAHIQRIGLYAAHLAKALGLSQTEVDDIRTAAPMHDIGKIGIADEILKKPGRLTPEEFTIMKGHSSIGAEILGGSNIRMIQMAADIAGNHHEFWQGGGYPRGIKGEQIPMPARIVSVVDVYDALVHKRVYKDAIPEDQSLEMMGKLVGLQFDPTVFELFLQNMDTLREIRMSIKDEE
jgi:response regulator RpfG family c-di-GMP phosphodiesterase